MGSFAKDVFIKRDTEFLPALRRQYSLLKMKYQNWRKFTQSKMRDWQRFPLALKVIMMSPIAIWLIIFNLYPRVPFHMRPGIDVQTLPSWENILLFGYDAQFFPKNLLPSDTIDGDQHMKMVALLDVLAAAVYFAHFAAAWLFGVFLLIYYKKRAYSSMGKEDNYKVLQPWTFFWCLGWLNIVAVLTQFVWPTAPPWYTRQFGFQPASHDMQGDPAGLASFDKMIGFPFFTNIYRGSPIVFGSFPSLHAAWPFLITLCVPTHNGLLWFWLGMSYSVSVWWAAVYLNHHFVVDIIGGVLFVLVAYWAGTWTAIKLADRDWVKSHGINRSPSGRRRARLEADDKAKSDNDLVLYISENEVVSHRAHNQANDDGDAHKVLMGDDGEYDGGADDWDRKNFVITLH